MAIDAIPVRTDTINVTLQEIATSTGNGTAFAVEAFKTLTIEISGTSTSRTIHFEGSSVGGTYYPIMGARLSDLETNIQTTGTGEVWQFNITGLVNFRVRLSAVDGGNVSVKGRAVA